MNALQGRTGKTSTMRVLTAFVVVTTMLTWVAANIKCWITGCQMVPMDAQSVALIIGTLAAKAGQVFAEAKTDTLPRDKGE